MLIIKGFTPIATQTAALLLIISVYVKKKLQMVNNQFNKNWKIIKKNRWYEFFYWIDRISSLISKSNHLNPYKFICTSIISFILKDSSSGIRAERHMSGGGEGP